MELSSSENTYYKDNDIAIYHGDALSVERGIVMDRLLDYARQES